MSFLAQSQLLCIDAKALHEEFGLLDEDGLDVVDVLEGKIKISLQGLYSLFLILIGGGNGFAVAVVAVIFFVRLKMELILQFFPGILGK